MASRKHRTRSSIRFCQENFSCKVQNSEATVECKECESVQCESCDISIHNSQRNRHHDRQQLEKPDERELCQKGKCNGDKNFADVWCGDCNNGYCYTCDGMSHKHKKRGHQRVQFQMSKLLDNDLDSFQLTNEDNAQILRDISTELENDLFYSSSYDTNDNTAASLSNISVTSRHSTGSKSSLPDIVDYTIDLQDTKGEDDNPKNVHGFMLFDSNECLQVSSDDDFVMKLSCTEQTQVKVVSIFGNTGDGKSHTLNHTFFGGQEVFKTSSSQDSCTMGAWAAYDSKNDAVIIDTEGLLGVSANSNQRTRMLLKVLAVSDVIIYRTKAERLHDDLFYFLGDASKAYRNHFYKELKSRLEKCHFKNMSNLGPSVIIFHETFHTNTLKKDTAVKVLREKFTELEIDIEAFNSLQYVGTRTERPPTKFTGLLSLVKENLKDKTLRSHRKPLVIYQALQVLNEKFSGEIERCLPASFPDQYFTCASKCLSCGCRCSLGMNHEQDNLLHESELRNLCRYQHQYENKVYLCKSCYDKGEKVVVVPKATSSKDSAWLGLASYAWSGYVLECKNCGVIYRSRQYWYGNEDPDKSSVKTEIRHVWQGVNTVLQGTHNAARRLVDGLTYMTDTIASVSAKPASVVGQWVTDQIAPAYWVPNAKIKNCYKCAKVFSEALTIHHCRACGQGFCEECSSKRRPVPERGWGTEPVRVCIACFKQKNDLTDSSASEGEGIQVTLRKGVEVMGSTVATVVNYPLEALKESSRPTYWVADEEIENCYVCKKKFGPTLRIHHCRSCGQGVCSKCSPHLKSVVDRGWDHPVRVCEKCVKKRTN